MRWLRLSVHVLFKGMIIGLLTFLKPSFITDGLRGADVDRDSSSTFTKWNFQNSQLAMVISLILLNSLSVSIWNVEVMTRFNSLIWNSDILFMCMWEQMSHATNDNSHTHLYVFVRTNEPCHKRQQSHVFMCMREQMSHATNDNSHTHLYVYVRTNEPVFGVLWPKLIRLKPACSYTETS